MDIQVKLLDVQITETVFKVKTYDKSVTNELETQLSVNTGFNDDKNTFAIFFKIVLENKTKNFYLTLEACAHFETSVEIDDGFQKSSFIKINAPAIAFPYVRTFISNLTLNSGFAPIILPSYNFVKFAQEQNA